jgi:arylsulfatase A-like enzyme
MEAAIARNKQMYPGKRDHRGPVVEAVEAPDDAYPDGRIAAEAIKRLQGFVVAPDQPFFLAVGFLKPHLPFVAPKRYWDLYDREKIAVPENYSRPPKDAPAGAVHQSGELRAYAGIPPTGPLNEDAARELIHGYYACVSFADAQVGRLLDELERLGLARNTIVVLWGDHGWQLGDHGMWNKHSCFETSMHAPLWVTAPMRTDVVPGTRVAALTEFIDIYPSLCELAGLPIPEHVQGTSFLPQMRNPALPGKAYAVGRFGAGDTIRSDGLRFTQYSTPAGEVTGTMLYDHRVDPRENVNVAAVRFDEAKQLQEELRAIALPPAR